MLSEVFSEAKLNENIVLYSSTKGRGQKEIRKIFRNMFY